MMRISKTLVAILSIAACGISTAVFADNPVGFYVGAGLGQSQVRSNDSNYGYPGYYNDYQFAWKAFVGIRPISILGAEFEYIDFGEPNCNGYYNNYYSGYCNIAQNGINTHPTATALFAVGYLPIPVPNFDIFAKAGAARLSLNVPTFNSIPCVAGSPCPNYSVGPQQSVTDTKFAYGAGVQYRFPFIALSLRAEYERISSQYGDPDALMVSAFWTF
jgi:opacity protein-like surface antigen